MSKTKPINSEVGRCCILEVLFSPCQGDSHAEVWGYLHMQAMNDHMVTISLSHHQGDRVDLHQLAGNEGLIAVPIRNGDTFTLQASRAGEIFAQGCMSVSMELAKQTGAALFPQALYHLLLLQRERIEECAVAMFAEAQAL